MTIILKAIGNDNTLLRERLKLIFFLVEYSEKNL